MGSVNKFAMVLTAVLGIFVLSACSNDRDNVGPSGLSDIGENETNDSDSDNGAGIDAWIDSFNGSDWSFRQKVVLSADLADSDLIDFPALIRIEDPGNPVFSKAGADGSDIVLTLADGVTELFHEIESFDPATGRLVAWVRLPVLSGTTDTTVYMYYGNSAVTTPMENPFAVWDDDYQLVYHLGRMLADSTGNSAPTDIGTADTDGKMGHARQFNGVDNHISTGWTYDPANLPDRLTFSCWVYAASLPDASFDEGIVHKTQGGMLSWSHTSEVYRGAFTVKATTGGWNAAKFNIDSNDLGRWIYLVGTYASGSLRAYKDGVLINENTQPEGAVDPGVVNHALTIGKHSDPSSNYSKAEHHFRGDIDEVHVSTTVRSSEWIKASFLNQSAPHTYQTLGAEESY